MKKKFLTAILTIFTLLNLNAVMAEESDNSAQNTKVLKQALAPYVQQIQQQIKSNWVPPKTGTADQKVVVLYTIARDGSLIDSKIYSSSGNKEMEATALDAIKKSAPFEPLPEQFKGERLNVHHTFNFSDIEDEDQKAEADDEEKKDELPEEGEYFVPYMAKLEKEIRSNWYPPKEFDNRKVVVQFTIAKDGSLFTKKIVKSSGNSRMDQSAVDALEDSFPFDELPKDFKGRTVDVNFTFDYSVLKPSARRERLKEETDEDYDKSEQEYRRLNRGRRTKI